MSEERKPQAEDKYIIRFPDGMRDRLKEAAKANNRTMNAELVARLEESFTKRVSVGDERLAIDTYLATLENQAAMTSMRIQMAEMQLQSHRMRLQALLSYQQRKEVSQMSNEELDAFARGVEELGSLRMQIELLERELNNLHADKEATLKNITGVRTAIRAKVSELEAVLQQKNKEG